MSRYVPIGLTVHKRFVDGRALGMRADGAGAGHRANPPGGRSRAWLALPPSHFRNLLSLWDASLRTWTYATWPMHGAAPMCYDSWRERGPLAAVDAENRSLRKGSTPPGPHVVTDLPLACAARQRLATARGLW